MNPSTRRNLFLCRLGLSGLILLLALPGCGETEPVWPSRPQDDWIKNVNGKGMANIWGVAMNVNGIGDSSVTYTPQAVLGATSEESSGKNVIGFGSTVIELATTGSDKLQLTVNGRKFGTVRVGSRVSIDEEGSVFVGDEVREPLKKR